MMCHVLDRLGLTVPVIQAPMAGTSTPELAAAVSNSGGLGSIAVGAGTPADAEVMINRVRGLTQRPFNVNVFCHRPAKADPALEQAWLARLDAVFKRFGAAPPTRLREIYTSFIADSEMVEVIRRTAPSVVSFHFGLPSADIAKLLKSRGSLLLATVTSLTEASRAAEVGIDAIVAQGYEAGGHRGTFDPRAADDCLGTFPLVRLLTQRQQLPVIAAGGIMDGAGVAAALALGAVAAQLGTAFIACPESAADSAYRQALASDAAHHTMMTRVISGRPARCLANAFARWGGWGEGIEPETIPDYPIAYDAGKALNIAAKAAGETGYGAHWAGQGAPLSRSMPAALLTSTLAEEFARARSSLRSVAK
jgi:nitronate monooxygenase